MFDLPISYTTYPTASNWATASCCNVDSDVLLTRACALALELDFGIRTWLAFPDARVQVSVSLNCVRIECLEDCDHNPLHSVRNC